MSEAAAEAVPEQRQWIDQHELEDAVAACNLLPGPASTQLCIFIARRLRGPRGALIGGLGFILPAVIVIVALSAVSFGEAPPAPGRPPSAPSWAPRSRSRPPCGKPGSSRFWPPPRSPC
jgi:hypothetical protein